MPKNEHYVGREQSLVKHYILQHYLERFAHIIGFTCNTITYIDCFSGPWQSNSSDKSDTSFAIALQELRKARETHADRKKLNIRCMFLEENAVRHKELKEYADKQTDVTVVTRNAALLDSIPNIVNFVQQGGSGSFPFIFIDPTGWSGFDLKKIRPLLQLSPGEVLVNFMTEHIRRFVSPKETRADIIDSFSRLFGSEEDFDRIRKVPNAQDREDELFMTYANRVKETGKFPFTCPATVLHPDVERTYFHLIYATRHPRGVEVFKDVEKHAYPFQERLRSKVKEAKQPKKTKSMFAEEEAELPSPRARNLRARYLAAAFQQIQAIRAGRKQVPYDEIWATVLAFPLVWESDLKDWIAEQKRAKRIDLLGLAKKQRVPQPEKGHIVEFIA